MQKELLALARQKEDEVTWSKIDNLFLKITEELKTKEDACEVYSMSKDLLLRSILSDRSKLSGTAIGLLKVIVDFMEGQLENTIEVLQVLLKVCGRSNRIVSRRGHDAFVHICKYIDLSPFAKTMAEAASSTNKNVRLTVFKGFEAAKEIPKSLEKVVLKGKDDPFFEVRTIAKALGEGKNKSNENESIQVVESKSKINFVPFKEYKPIASPSNSPFRKIAKLESKANEKLNAIEEKVRAITTSKINKSKVQKIVEAYKTRDLLSTIPKKEKEVHDDLTPKKLDKFLLKYRNVYGNVLEEKKEELPVKESESKASENAIDINEGKEEQATSIDEDELKVEENIKEVKECDLNENVGEAFIEEGVVEALSVSPVFNTEPFDLNANDAENKETPNTIETIVDEYDQEEQSLEKGLESLSLIIEDELPSLKSNQFEYTIVNSEQDPPVESPATKCPPVNQTKCNRFSPLLYADKDECLIFDVKQENFKTPTNNIPHKDAFTSPLDVHVVPNSLSSSFLYSKGEERVGNEEQVGEDFTQIGSIIYADKKTFTRNNE